MKINGNIIDIVNYRRDKAFETLDDIQIGYFNKEYLKSAFVGRKLGRILNDSYERRNALDYHDFATVTKSEIKEYLMNRKDFVKEIDKIIQEKISLLTD